MIVLALPLAVIGAILCTVALGRAIMYTVRDGNLDPRLIGTLVLLGLLGGAALTPLADHLGW